MLLNDALRALLDAATTPVILLEGTRQLPAGEHARLQEIATHLFHAFPRALSRSVPHV